MIELTHDVLRSKDGATLFTKSKTWKPSTIFYKRAYGPVTSCVEFPQLSLITKAYKCTKLVNRKLVIWFIMVQGLECTSLFSWPWFSRSNTTHVPIRWPTKCRVFNSQACLILILLVAESWKPKLTFYNLKSNTRTFARQSELTNTIQSTPRYLDWN